MPWAEVVKRSEGLILLSGGVDGPVDRLFAQGRAADGDPAAWAELIEPHRVRLKRRIAEHDGEASAALTVAPKVS